MQTLARDGVSEKRVKDAVAAVSVDASWGVDLLDTDMAVTEEGMADALGCDVTWRADKESRGVRLTLGRVLDWQNVLVRPWQEIAGARFYQGVFALETPRSVAMDGKFEADGYDLTTWLKTLVGDTYVVAEDANILDAVRQMIVDAGLGWMTVNLDPSREDATAEHPLVWAFDVDNPVTWLDVVNAALTLIGYGHLYVDEVGAFRADRYVAASSRTSEWLLDMTDSKTLTLNSQRTVTFDNWDAPNHFTGVRSGMTSEPAPGAGILITDKSGGGRQIPAVKSFDVMDQTALTDAVAAWVQDQVTRVTSVQIKSTPLPQLSHNDIATYKDPRARLNGKALVTSWTTRLADSAVDIALEMV